MITLTRASAHRVRAFFRRAFGSSQRLPVWIRLLAGPDGLRMQALHNQVGIEFRLFGPVEPEELCIPLELLSACEAKNGQEPVRLRKLQSGQVLAEWLDRQIPQQFTADKPSQELVIFPQAPTEFIENRATLIKALADACATTDAESSRFALGCLSLRGKSGSLVATDGRQLLVQRGWTFPWTADVLVPASKVFATPELVCAEPVHVGRAEDRVWFKSGPWTICLPIQKDGRFPQVDDLVRNPVSASSRLTISPADAKFAIEAIKRLPVEEDGNSSITLDVNGEVLLRSRVKLGTPATEVSLSTSHKSGQDVRLVTDRNLLSRALSLGFSEFGLFGANSALQATDERRHYIWMPHAETCVVPADKDTRRISSPLVTARGRKRASTENCNALTAVSVPASAESSASQFEVPVATAEVILSPLEQITALRGGLRDALTQTQQLLRSLQKPKKRSRSASADKQQSAA